MDHTQELRIISLCTGYGGLDEGIRRAIAPTPLREIAYVEIESFAIANLVAKMEANALPPAPIWSDLKTFPMEGFRGKVHGIVGGYPCQPFSAAGQRRGTEDPRHLWPYIREIVSTVRPVWCFFENVSGHLNLGFDEVYRSLRDMGYRVEAGLFTAAEVGAPHKRERLFILAVLNTAVQGLEGGFKWFSKRKRYKQSSQAGRTEELGNAEYDGQPAEQKLRGYEKAGNEWGQEEPPEASESSRTDRPTNVRGIQRGAEGSELADSSNKRSGGSSRYEQRKAQNTTERCGEWMGKLADSYECRGWKNIQPTELRSKGVEQSSCYCGASEPCESKEGRCDSKWPSRPGQPQYAWEHPRTISKEEIKSGVGCPAHGPGFREDLLRALGNGVVPQQAEKAWHYLWEKMGVCEK